LSKSCGIHLGKQRKNNPKQCAMQARGIKWNGCYVVKAANIQKLDHDTSARPQITDLATAVVRTQTGLPRGTFYQEQKRIAGLHCIEKCKSTVTAAPSNSACPSDQAALAPKVYH
jgi:hypothetical protein